MSERPNRRVFQFSLRTALAVMGMVACFFGGWKARDIAAYTPPETFLVDGVVLGEKDGIYELSVGSDDAVAVGTKFSVFRGSVKLGEIGVIDTSPDRSVGLLLESQASRIARFWQPTTPPVIQKGDKVQAVILKDQMKEMRKYYARPTEMLSS
jgi:hypothetical protein